MSPSSTPTVTAPAAADDLAFETVGWCGDAASGFVRLIDQTRLPTEFGLWRVIGYRNDVDSHEHIALVLGDNIFYGQGFSGRLRSAAAMLDGCTLFGYPVKDPERYGVIEFDPQGKAKSIEEKPRQPRSRYAVTGFYFLDGRVSDIAARLKPSARGEHEITDVLNDYLQRGELSAVPLGRGLAWLDTGTHEALLEAAHFIETIERRQGLKIACPEEVAYRMGFIDARQLEELARPLEKSSYGQYLRSVLAKPRRSDPGD